MLLAFTGLRSMGLIVFDSATLLTLGGCPASSRNYLYAFDQQVSAQTLANLTFSDFPPPATVYGCLSDNVGGIAAAAAAAGFEAALLVLLGGGCSVEAYSPRQHRLRCSQHQYTAVAPAAVLLAHG
jgi:hypothetical protein